MYRKETEGWLKHYDFILLDLICLLAAYVIAYAFSGQGWSPWLVMLYRNMGVFLILTDIVVIFSHETLKGVLKRDAYAELKITIRHVFILCGLSLIYLFLLQQSGAYSRLAFFLTFLLYSVLTYIVRLSRKKVLRKKMTEGSDRTLLIVSSSINAPSVIEKIKANNYAGYILAGVVLTDQPIDAVAGQTIDGIPVVADAQTAPRYVCQKWVDELLIVPAIDAPDMTEHADGTEPWSDLQTSQNPDSQAPNNQGADVQRQNAQEQVLQKLIDKLLETGVTVHLNLANLIEEPGKKQFVERVGGYTVLTTSINYASAKELFLKRAMDIAAGIAGCILTGILFIFLAPAIYISSPGPIFFTQERVGKNGKTFKMYKFRSMYPDAEERKAELMKENESIDSKMFKLDFDPRVIGNKILPDGTQKTGIGQFIRNTSLDEFPQFYNVLKGEMSLVGTRPPTVGEVNLYDLHHRSRLAIKPGITGMWQVSGRSDITDFEEVLKLDRQYISEWSLWLDIKILFKTVAVVLKRKGSR